MTTAAIITRVDHKATKICRDNVERYFLEVHFKKPFTNSNGNLNYDHFIGSFSTPARQQELDKVNALCGKEVQIVCYFYINDYTAPDGTARYYQSCNIRNIYDNAPTPQH